MSGRPGMIGTVRPIQWAGDRAAISALDLSFSTDRMYTVTRGALEFSLESTAISPPLEKSYVIDWSGVSTDAIGLVVERNDRIAGFACLSIQTWNRRAVIDHLYVDRPLRGSGLGTMLITALTNEARLRDARQLWVETQNVNAPAIDFYLRNGFRCCGLDTDLYDPASTPNEVAVYFAKRV